MKKLYLHSFKTDWGTIRTAATDNGLAVIALPGESGHYFESSIEANFKDYEICAATRVNRQAEKQLRDFLNGKRKRFDLKLDLQGTTFQKKVLKRVAAIPYGKTMSYSDVAGAVGHPRACRAVGSANGQNLLPLVVPCHRVVAVNGLGGYGGGLGMKKKLLKMEGSI